MSPRRGSATASSPHSEHDTTFHGTPSTNTTSFTPATGSKCYRKPTVEDEEVIYHRNWDKARDASKHGSIKRTVVTKPAGSLGDDVFLTAPTSGNVPQLSPTAQVFKPKFTPRAAPPRANRNHAFAPTHATQIVGLDYFPSENIFPTANNAGVRPLLQDSIPDRKPKSLADMQAPVLQARDPRSYIKPIGGTLDTDIDAYLDRLGVWNISHMNFMMNASGKYINDVHFTEGVFSTDENAVRAFAVIGVPPDFRSRRIAEAFKLQDYPSLKTINASQVVGDGLFTVAFSDVRDAKKAWDVAAKLSPHTRIFPMAPRGVAADQGYNPSHVSDFEGQLIVTVYYNGNPNFKQLEAAPIVAEIKRLLAQCGEVKAMHTLPSTQLHCRDFRVEYFDSQAVPCARDVISGTILEGGAVLHAEAYSPDIVFRADDLEAPFEQLSITGRSTVPVDEDYDRLAYAITRDVLRNGRRLNNANHNAVDIARIQSGMDVRTTIMLRNIPNRVDQAMLKEIVDQTSFGRYDFMYLRIDFANNCNVGYAFINFVDAPSIIPFVLARAGKRWNCFNSDKIAEVSYATIQGKDCLVQKFRNSSVMLEHPAFRPKLYIAGNVPDAGEEEKFPTPDNHSKMRRSVENAEHVGLYIPRTLAPAARHPAPSTPKLRRRLLRRTVKSPVESLRRNAFYLSPARGETLYPAEVPDSPPPRPSPRRRRPVSFLVDTNSPYDPFAGNLRPFS
ncbi:hypothetical protein LTR99_001470 [Exophiala xenobiotica]|uniref:RRM domain-containing protein n=1 Tax=Vermiconidia calcicola TaxID=1690605 RepID=A0AAV9QM89_9PEZI|nr:hypothetical protein LTR14_007139 [Exophiala xenobiotica]KAK5543980.1 hypothetical protein LTR25_001595 [Vermiconidia calcicola]KAK5308494.1 hypothetical protein LTR99_001470 [Exophiala xenobiotica]KAK5410618.1 hypothetical protein LTR90_008201 [Exophiala xenobiotica]KAK5437996.1 hypothetical protein LTR34_001544 [Exophiala xenobiotica]